MSRVRSRAVVGGAFVLGVAFLAGPITPAPVEAIGPLPGCELGDVYTVPRGYDDWSVTLVDRLLRVEDDYVPPDLVNVSEAGLPGGGLIRAVAIDDLRDLAEAAAANGTPIGVWSAYRSFDVQTEIFNGYANQFGFENAITYSHRPGHSEHQLGLAIDFMSAGGGNPMPGDWATTPAGAWMRDNAWEYGWVNSYPLGDPPNPLWNEKACFGYEPWQYRYLGREIAAAVHKSGLTIREYLWANYTMVDPVTGLPIPTATPTPSPTPTPDPTPTPTQAPSPTASPELSIGTPDLTGEWFGLALPLVLGLALVGLLVVLTPIALLVRRGSSGR